MKKNDVMGYVVYALMLGGAVGVGFGAIRPLLIDNDIISELPMPGVVLVLISVLAGTLLSALILELGHLLGAKIGKYKVMSWNCLFICFKRDKNGSIELRLQ